MGTKAECRDGLATRIATITSLATRVSARWPGQVSAPWAVIRSAGGVPHTTFASNGAYKFIVTVMVSMQDVVRAQTALDLYTALSGAASIIAAIEGDLTLGGKAEYCLLSDWDEDGEIAFGGVPYLGAELPVEVHTSWT